MAIIKQAPAKVKRRTPAPKPKHKPTKLVNFASIAKFATLKGVSRVAIYAHIGDKRIIPEYVGIAADPYIDLDKYKDYTFSK